MGLFDFITGEFIEIIEWQQGNDDEVMCWKFPHRDNAIKNGAKLVVREGQRALFLSMGALPPGDMPADLVSIETSFGGSLTFVGDSFAPGTYTLETRTLPILGRIQGWKYGFESPFKADVFFVSTRRFTDLKWGTSNPIMIRDKEFGPIRIRAFGTYAIQVSEPVKFLRQLVSTDPSFEAYEIASQLRSLIVARVSNALAASGIPVLDMAANTDALAKLLQEKIAPELAEMGLAVPMFFIENVSLPPNLEEILDKRASTGLIGNLDQYIKFQTAESIPDAMKNPGGMAGFGAQMSAGMAIGGQMAQALTPGAQQPPQSPDPNAGAMPPPLPGAVQTYVGLEGKQAGPFDANVIKGMIANGQITRETPVWRQGMAGWTPAGQAPDLAGLFNAPPPL